MSGVGTVVVAGASGWIGRAVVQAAHGRGLSVTPLVVRADPAVAQEETVARVAGLLSGAGTALVNAAGRSWGSVRELWEANVVVSEMLATACLEADARYLGVGSAAEYGVPAAAFVAETDPAQPVDDYGRSKGEASERVSALRRAGLDATTARVFNVVGPGRPGTSPLGDFAAAIRVLGGRDGVVEVRDSTLVRDLSSLTWVAERLVDLAVLTDGPDIVNVCSGRPTTYRRLVEGMAAAGGSRVEIVDTRPGGVPRVVGDASRLRRLLPSAPEERFADLCRVALES